MFFFASPALSSSRSARALRPPRQLRIPPVDSFQHVGHLRRGDRHAAPLRRRPNELSPVEPLGVKRQPDAVVPEDLRQIAPAPAEEVEIAAVRIALQLLLNLKRQPLHAATHVGVARRDPHPNPARHRDHRSPRTLRTRRSAAASTLLSTRTRLPEPSSISMTPDLVRRPLVARRDGLAASDPDGAAIAPISTGSKIESSLLAGSAVRASLRHVKSRLCAPRAVERPRSPRPTESVSLQRSATSRPCSTALGARSRKPSYPSLRHLKASPKVTPFPTTELPSKVAAAGRLLFTLPSAA